MLDRVHDFQHMRGEGIDDLKDSGFRRRLNDGDVGCRGVPPGATPWCSAVIFRRLEKRLILKDFSAVG
jgi:hypothetical protein